MPATVTLSTSTLTVGVNASDTQLTVASISGLTIGRRLFCEGELMSVVGFGVGTQVNVGRGVDGTVGAPHDAGTVFFVARPDQFYSVDPKGRPPAAIPVSPYINVLNGTVWFAQGDATPSGTANRWWQAQTTTYGTGSLGVRTVSSTPTTST
jgi:hypothetical protein